MIGAAKTPHKIIQKELDFAWERSVTTPAPIRRQVLSGILPRRLFPRAGFRW